MNSRVFSDLLFHLSPFSNRSSIARVGLRPRYDQRYRGRVWLCDFNRLPWAIRHVADHHGVDAGVLDLWAASIDRGALRRTREGVFYAAFPVNVQLVFSGSSIQE